MPQLLRATWSLGARGPSAPQAPRGSTRHPASAIADSQVHVPAAKMSKTLRNNAPLTARIKKLMQSDDDVGKVAKASPVLIAKALDIFLHNLVQGAVEVAEGRGARTLTCAHVKAHVNSDPLLDFIKETVAAAPDLPPPGSEEASAPKPKRQRVSSTGEEGEGSATKAGGRGRGRGRGGGAGSRGSGGTTGRGRGRGRRKSGGAEAELPAAAAAGQVGLPQLASPTAASAAGPVAEEPAAAAAATSEPMDTSAPQQQQQQSGLEGGLAESASQVNGALPQAASEMGSEQEAAVGPLHTGVGSATAQEPPAAALQQDEAGAVVQMQQPQQQQAEQPQPPADAGAAAAAALAAAAAFFATVPAGVGGLPEEEDYDAE